MKPPAATAEPPGPVFIGGLSRSGKTQLRVVLQAHPDLALTRRTYLWDRFYGRFGDLSRPRNLTRCLAAMLVDERVALLAPDGARIRREFRDGPATYANLFGLLHRHHAERIGKRRWGEQLGFVERFAEPIFEAYPSARMIHLIRDPRSSVDGRHGSRRPGGLGWGMARWLHSARLARRNRERYADRYLVVRYETFAGSAGTVVDEVCAFLDLERVPAMERALASVSFEPDERERGRGERGRPDPSSVAFVDRYAHAELRALGYAAVSPPEPLASVRAPIDLAAMTAWRLSSERRAPRRVRR